MACLRHGSLVNPASSVLRVGVTYLIIASSMLSSLYRKVGVLQRNDEFARFSTVSIAMQNIGVEFFHPIGRISSITTKSLSSLSDKNTIPSLGLSVGRKPMKYEPSLTP